MTEFKKWQIGMPPRWLEVLALWVGFAILLVVAVIFATAFSVASDVPLIQTGLGAGVVFVIAVIGVLVTPKAPLSHAVFLILSLAVVWIVVAVGVFLPSFAKIGPVVALVLSGLVLAAQPLLGPRLDRSRLARSLEVWADAGSSAETSPGDARLARPLNGAHPIVATMLAEDKDVLSAQDIEGGLRRDR